MQTLQDAWLLAISRSACRWYKLQNISPNITSTSVYPYPFVAFGSMAPISSTTAALFGGVRNPGTFFNNANLNAPSNAYMLLFKFDFNLKTFEWTPQTFDASSTYGAVLQDYFALPHGNVGLSLVALIGPGILMSFGGFSSYITECTTAHFVISIRSSTQLGEIWTRTLPFFEPENMYQAASVAVTLSDTESILILTGGQIGDSIYHDTLSIWLFPMAYGSGTGTNWLRYSPFMASARAPIFRWGHSAVFLHEANTMIIFGGYETLSAYGSIVTSNELWLCHFSPNFDSYSWELLDLSPAPAVRAEHTAVMYGSWMVVYGGFPTSVSALAYSDLWLLDLAKNLSDSRWISVPQTAAGGALLPVPPPRGGHSAGYLITQGCVPFLPSPGGVMMLFGGASTASTSSVYSDMWSLLLEKTDKTITGTWYPCPSLAPGITIPIGRQAGASIVMGNRAWFLVGGLAANNTAVGDTWIYTTNAGWFQPPLVARLPGIYYHTLVGTMSIQRDQAETDGGTIAESSNTAILTVLGGLLSTTPVDGTQPFVDISARLTCPKGFYLALGEEPCSPCPIGTYSVKPGTSKCISCQNNILTNATGASSPEFCNVCLGETLCHGRGECSVSPLSNTPTCACSGWYRYSDNDMCATPIVGIIVGCIVPGTLLLGALAWRWKGISRSRKRYQEAADDLNLRLIERETEGQLHRLKTHKIIFNFYLFYF